jgi:hypothetical protein
MTDHDPLPEPPAPSREFADRLRERLHELDALARRPPHLWAMVAAYAVAGIALLLAAVGVAV